ncbi:MAG: adenylate kinase [Actinomycetota bacterium]
MEAPAERPRLQLLLIGPQGAGKGTQGDRLARWYRMPHVATGELLRAAIRDGLPLGLEAKTYMDSGELVPDELVISILDERFRLDDARNGFILDGFPRTTKQAAALDDMLDGDGSGNGINAVVSLEVPDPILVQRLSDRWTCLQCGRVYNTTDHQPVEPGHCNNDGSLLVHREDDNPDAIKRRLALFHSETKPVIEFYEDNGLVEHIEGVGRIEEVQGRIVAALARRGFRRG